MSIEKALEGLFAYDTGCVSSGIKDELLRKRCKNQLRDMPEDEFRLRMSRAVREMFLTEKALKQRYGIEDVASFLKWLAEKMDVDLF